MLLFVDTSHVTVEGYYSSQNELQDGGVGSLSGHTKPSPMELEIWVPLQNKRAIISLQLLCCFFVCRLLWFETEALRLCPTTKAELEQLSCVFLFK